MYLCPVCGKRVDATRCPKCDIGTLPVEGDAASFPKPNLGRGFEGRYSLGSFIDTDGIWSTFHVIEIASGHPRIVKVLQREMTANVSLVDRFTKAARSSSTLTNPHTARVFDVGLGEDGSLYLVTELLQGETLKDLLAREGRIPWRRAMTMIRQVCESLEEAHDKGITHKDLKPSTIFLATTPAGSTVKVLETGLTKIVPSGSGEFALGETGMLVGSPHYVAPEQATSRKSVDHRADIYALGTIVYEMLVGEPVFQAKHAMTILMKHVNEPPPEGVRFLVAEGLPPSLANLVYQLLAKRPDERPQTISEIIQQLDAALEGTDAPSSPQAPEVESTGQEVPRAESPIITAEEPLVEQQPAQASSDSKTLMLIAVILGIMVIAMIVFFVLIGPPGS